MVLYYDEFKEYSSHSASLLRKMNSDEKCFVHEIDVSDVKIFLGSEGRRSFAHKKVAILDYLQWLFQTYQIDTSDLYQEIRSLTAKEIHFQEIYFYSLDEFHKEIDHAFESAYTASEVSGEDRDFDGLKVYFLLQWYGVSIEEFISIKLSDVNDRKIYIPENNRTIIVDERTADVIEKYKNKEGVVSYSKEGGHIIPYKQNTLYRTKRGQRITKKSIENIRSVFSKYYKDPRLTKNRIANSGRYYQLLEIENQLGRDIAAIDVDIINQVFRSDTENVWTTIQDFKLYKDNREMWLSTQDK